MTALLLHDLNHFRSPITQGKYVEKCPCILPLWMFSSSSAYISMSSFHPGGSSPLWKRMHTDILREFMLMGSKNKKQKKQPQQQTRQCCCAARDPQHHGAYPELQSRDVGRG